MRYKDYVLSIAKKIKIVSNFSKWLEKELPADVLRMEAELGGTLHVEDAVLEDVV